MQGIFQKENTDKALKYGIYRHLPTYEKIIRNLVSFSITKMGKKYEKRYCTYFKNPDIQRHNMQHEELFCCHSAEWVEEVRKAVEGDKQ